MTGPLRLRRSITTDFTGGGGRVHYVNVTLTPASYLDSTGLNSPGGVLTLGYRAGFAGYAAYPDPSATQVRIMPCLLCARSSSHTPSSPRVRCCCCAWGQASDTLVLLFSVSPLVLSTERALRFGILQARAARQHGGPSESHPSPPLLLPRARSSSACSWASPWASSSSSRASTSS